MHSARRSRSQVPGPWVLLAVLGVLVAGCSPDPYAELDPEELAFVIPGSAPWGSGDPCAEADCGGETEVGALSSMTWVVVDTIAVLEGSVGDAESVVVSIDGESIDGGAPASFRGRAWGGDVGQAVEADDRGLEIWVATSCPGVEADLVCELVAFDLHGRLAGLGYGRAMYLTVPLARAAAVAEAEDGRSFMEQLLSDR